MFLKYLKYIHFKKILILPGITLSLSPSRRLKILGRLGELVNFSVSICIGNCCCGKFTKRAEVEGAVILAPIVFGLIGPDPLLDCFKICVGLFERFMATGCPTPPPGALVLAM